MATYRRHMASFRPNDFAIPQQLQELAMWHGVALGGGPCAAVIRKYTPQFAFVVRHGGFIDRHRRSGRAGVTGRLISKGSGTCAGTSTGAGAGAGRINTQFGAFCRCF